MPMTKPGKFDSQGAWDGFRGEMWQEEINVRDFIQKNYTPYVLVPGLTDSRESLEALYDFIRELKSVERVEILPYHTMGVHKWEALGIPYSLKNVLPPTEEEVRRAEEILRIK